MNMTYDCMLSYFVDFVSSVVSHNHNVFSISNLSLFKSDCSLSVVGERGRIDGYETKQ